MAIIFKGNQVAGVGKPGESAYEIALKNGYEGSEEQFAQELNEAANFETFLDDHNVSIDAHQDIRDLISSVDVSAPINAHNTSNAAHADIRALIDTKIETLTEIAESKAPAVHTHTKNQITDFAHTHTKSQITDFPSSLPASDVSAWAKATSKPSYTASEVGARPNTWMPTAAEVGASATGHKHTKSEITDFPTSMTPTSHNHAASNINSGTLSSDRLPTVPITKGGTGATNAATARTKLGITPANIGAAASSHNHGAGNITSGTLPVARGGTGVTSLSALATALGVSSGKIEFKSYVGTGTCDASGASSLTFGFTPKLLLFYTPRYTGGNRIYLLNDISYLFWGHNTFQCPGSDTFRIEASYSGNTITWYATAGTSQNVSGPQFNGSGKTYYVIAFG